MKGRLMLKAVTKGRETSKWFKKRLLIHNLTNTHWIEKQILIYGLYMY